MNRCIALSLAVAAAGLLVVTLAVQLSGWSSADSDSRVPPDRRGVQLQGAVAPAATSSGWPNLFGPARNSISAEEGLSTTWGPEGPPELWRIPIGTGYSSPIVVGQQVIALYRQKDEEIVGCFEAETGAAIWEHRNPTAYECEFPPHSSGPYSTPAASDEHVYTLGAEGLLQCLRLDDGGLVWSRPLSDEYQVPEQCFAVGHSPLLLDGRLILNVGGTVGESGIVALDAATGETLWQATDHGASYATPMPAVVHDQLYVFVLTDRGLVSLDPQTGRVFWTIPFSSGNKEAPAAVTPLVHGDLVLCTVFQVGTMCLRILPDGGYEELWRHRRSLESQFNPLVCIDGYVYGWHFSDKSLRCIDLLTGDRYWRYKSTLVRGTHIAVDGRLILYGEHGQLGSLEINPARAVEVSLTAEPLLESPCYSTPALHNGRLYLRNEQELACFDLRGDSSKGQPKADRGAEQLPR